MTAAALSLALATIATPAGFVDLSEGLWTVEALEASDGKVVAQGQESLHRPASGERSVRDAAPIVRFRRRVEVDPRWSEGPVALTLGIVHAAVEVRVDGVRVGGLGDLDGHRLPPPSVPIFEVPPALVADGAAEIVVTSRLSDALLGTQWGARLRGSRGRSLGPRAAVASVRSDTQGRLRLYLQPWVHMAVIGLLFALYHFHLWRRRRGFEGYLWFAVLSLAGAAMDGTYAAFSTGALGVGADIYAPCFRAGYLLVFVVGMQFALAFLGPLRPVWLWRSLQVAFCGLAAWALIGVGPPLAVGENLLVTGAQVVSALAIFGWATWLGRPHAGTVLVGMAAMLAFPLVVHRLDLGLSPTYGSLALNLAMALALSNHFNATIDDLDATNRAIRRFVPFTFLRLLGRPDVRALERGDQVRTEVAVLFADLRGFTARAEQLGPEATFALIDRYVAAMERPIVAEGGVINDLFGDGIMALFPNDPAAAVRAARRMQTELRSIPELRDSKMGIGIHTGPLMLGTVGGETRWTCTVVGDPANLAARIQELTKTYDAEILVSDAVASNLGLEDAPLARDVEIRGRASPATIYAL